MLWMLTLFKNYTDGWLRIVKNCCSGMSAVQTRPEVLRQLHGLRKGGLQSVAIAFAPCAVS
eukprot:660622-Pyramimonas_sp.AAC.1